MDKKRVYSRTEHVARNSISGIIYSFINNFFPFVLKTILLKVLGDKYLGFNNLFHSVINVLNVAELGFGTAIGYCLYEPIANNNKEEICALLNLYRRIYLIIGTIVLSIGLLLIPYLDVLVNYEKIDGINLTFVYLIYLSEAVINYFFFSYKSSLLNALQRNDIHLNILSIVQTISYIIRIIFLIVFKNYYLFIIFIPIASLVSRFIINIITNNLYPEYKCIGNVGQKKKKDITKRVYALSISKLGDVLSISLDNIVVSMFLGLSSVAIHSNYYYVCTALYAITSEIILEMKASIGNSIVLDDVENNYGKFITINFINMCLCTIFTTCLFCCYQTFMKIWMGTKMMAESSLVACMCLYYFLSQYRTCVISFKDANGLWIQDKWRPLVSGILNIILNIFLIRRYGIIGPIMSTVISILLVDIPWETVVLFKGYFKRNILEYIKKNINFVVITLLSIFVSLYICSFISLNNYLEFFVRGIIAVLTSFIFITMFYHNNECYKKCVDLFKKYVLGRITEPLKRLIVKKTQ